jgi:PAS domain S-box-containing protein
VVSARAKPKTMVVKLRWLVFAMVSVALIPLAVVAILAISTAHRDQRADLDRALLEQARALGVAVDRQVETAIAALQGLATSSDLETGDLARFREQALRAKEARKDWLTVALIDPSGRQLLNLLRPPGTPLAGVGSGELFQRTVRTLKPEVSDLAMGVTAERWTIVVNVPLLRDGALRYILSAVMTPDGFASILAAAKIPDGSVGTIADRKGVVVATTRDQDRRVGRPASSDAGGLARPDGESVLPDTLDGQGVYTASSRAPASHFAVHITVPAEQLEAQLRRSLGLLSGTAAAAFAVALGLALFVGRRVSRRMAGLSDVVTAFSRGETTPAMPHFWVAEFSSMTRSLSEAMALLRTRTEALEASERRYRATFERNLAAMCLTRADGRVVACNEAAARLAGYATPAEMLGSDIAERYVDQKDRQQLVERIRADGFAHNVELQFRRRDGRLIWVLANVVRATDPAEADYEATLIDITEHKAAEELRSIARLANTAAHEINNPLTTIIGRLEMLRAESSLSPQVQERLGQAQAAAARIRQLVVDMNQLTRIEPMERGSSTLPEMIDIRKSAGGASSAGAPEGSPTS